MNNRNNRFGANQSYDTGANQTMINTMGQRRRGDPDGGQGNNLSIDDYSPNNRTNITQANYNNLSTVKSNKSGRRKSTKGKRG